MKCLINRKSFATAFASAVSVAPSRSPKPVLQNCKLTVHADGSFIEATDLEIGIRIPVSGVRVDTPGSVLLNPAKFGQILGSSTDEDISIELNANDQVTIKGLRSKYVLPTEDPDLFPAVPEWIDDGSFAVASADLETAIKRTIYATDVESTRYALGGVLFETGDDELILVATDGRRLSRQAIAASGTIQSDGPPVIPVKALKSLQRACGDDSDEGQSRVKITANQSAMFLVNGTTIYTRLVEGRFPRYQDVFPTQPATRIEINVGELSHAVGQSMITTSDESRGVDFAFGGGLLRLSGKAADVGESVVELPIGYDGDELTTTFDPRYLQDMLKTIDASSSISVEIVDHKSAVAFRVDGGFVGIVMPLTRDR